MKESFLSVIMPAFNEEKNILQTIDDTVNALDAFKIPGEIIVVNDGSRDNMKNLVLQAMKNNSRIRLINHSTAQGLGASFWDGVSNASGEIVSMFPGDNENDPYEILRYYQLLENVDLVIPFAYNKDVRSKFRVLLSFIYHRIINNTFGINLNYTNGTVLYRKAVLKQIKNRISGYFFQTDIQVRLLKSGYLFAEVPYKLRRRNFGKSSAVSFSSLFGIIKGYFRLLRDIYFKKFRMEIIADSATAKRKK